MNKRVWLIFGIAFLFGISLISASSSSPCWNPQSPGGVQIGWWCFNCGISDGICPSDFGAECNVLDTDCDYPANGHWSLMPGGAPAVPDNMQITLNLWENKTIYLVIANSGQSSGNITLNVTNKTNHLLARINARVDAQGIAIGNWTVRGLSDLGQKNFGDISELKFEWIKGSSKTISRKINIKSEFSAPDQRLALCSEYKNATECNSDQLVRKSIPFYFPSNNTACQYFNNTYCRWNETMGEPNCKTYRNYTANASNPQSCIETENALPTLNTECAYNEGPKVGNCDAGDAFIRTTYVAAQGYNPDDCPTWQSGAIPCPRRLKLDFFGLFGFLISILVICFAYSITLKRKSS